MRTTRTAAVCLLIALAAGCSGGDGGDDGSDAPLVDLPGSDVPPTGDDGTPDPGPSPDDGGPTDLPGDVPVPAVYAAVPGARCAPKDRVGLVTVSAEGDSRNATAELYDGPDPALGEPVRADEVCSFHQDAAACEPACSWEQRCAVDQCVAAPALAADAKLVLTAGGQSQTLTPPSAGAAVWGQVTLPGPYAVEASWGGLTVTLAETAVPAPLPELAGVLSGDSMAPTGLTLTWTPQPAGTFVFTHVPMNHHVGGATFTECFTGAEAGSLSIPGDMLLPLAQVTGLEFQGTEHLRIAAATTPRGCVEIRFVAWQYGNLQYR